VSEIVYYLFPALLVVVAIKLHSGAKTKQSRKHSEVLKESIESGLTEPPSLHPVIELATCVGSGGCVTACPENALGIINGKAVLINPSHCIGHGACAPACPVKAIKLVFGTAKRGIDIPQVSPQFETNVPGVFIAGELGGMGLIRNAIRQGTQSIDTISQRGKRKAVATDLDVLIVGAGPAGISASLAAQQKELRYVTIEQEDSLGGTTYHYPRNKLVMTAPMVLPIIGEIKVREVSKEQLMDIWQGILDKVKPEIRFSERMEEIIPEKDAYVVKTNKGSYRATNLLLAIGRRGTPRKLGAIGEENPKVVYRLIEAEQYRGKQVLVVGGGDSALEAALSICAEPGTKVSLSYRGNAFNRVKPKNRSKIEEAIASEQIDIFWESSVSEIFPDDVAISLGEERIVLPNHAIIVCTGGDLPTPMLKKIGVQVETRFGS
jgi:thioredoxin reductase (NADPH)